MVNYPPDYCPYCGRELETTEVEGRDRRYCVACDRIVWHNPVPCAGVAVVERRPGENAVLCVERAVPPGAGEWTIPGGHMELDETPREAAARELEEETGLAADPATLSILDAVTLPSQRGKAVVSICYAVDRADCAGDPDAGSDAAAARFWTPAAFEASGERFREGQVHRLHAASATRE